MGWKDTVIKRPPFIVPYGDRVDITTELEAQAEISFKAGWQRGWREGIDYSNERFKHKDAFKAGIKEVIEDIEANYMTKNSANPDFLRNGIIIASPEQWQAFKNRALSKGE